jgi:hypothetical protein
MKLEAKTLVDLKKKIRTKMKWPDRRTWTQEEHDEFDSKYKIEMDHTRNVFIVKEK